MINQSFPFCQNAYIRLAMIRPAGTVYGQWSKCLFNKMINQSFPFCQNAYIRLAMIRPAGTIYGQGSKMSVQ